MANSLFKQLKEEAKGNLKSIFSKDNKNGVQKIAEFLILKNEFKTIPGKKNHQIFRYNNGVYSTIDSKAIIREKTESILEELCTTHYVNEIVEKIARKTSINSEKQKMGDVNKNLICLNNGILNFRTGELLKHNPKYLFVSKIPVKFEPLADCPKIKKFFEDTFLKEDIKIMQEWLGYLLLREYIIKKALILLGQRDTGKTTFLNLAIRFIGEENKSGISLQKISQDRFASASLDNKHLNSFDDLSFKDIRDNGAFKMATGGGYIQAEHKFGDHFQFKNFAKLIFAANQIPLMKYDDDAYYSRWIIINCNNIFDDTNAKKDLHLIKKMTTQKELSGLLNYAIEGLKRLLKNGRFSYDRGIEEVRAIMQRSGSTLAAFIEDEICEESDSFITKQELYDAYLSYTAKKKTWATSLQKVSRELPTYLPSVRGKQRKVINRNGNKIQLRVWENIAFKKDSKFKNNQAENNKLSFDS